MAINRLKNQVSEPVAQTARPSRIKLATLPGYLGGGAYNIDAENTQNVVNTGHTNYGGLPTKTGFERDDIVPVSLGGANTERSNLRYESLLPKDQQAVGKLTLSDAFLQNVNKDYKAGKLTLPQARLKILTYKQNQDKVLGVNKDDQSVGKNFLKSLGQKAVSIFKGAAGGRPEEKKKDGLVFNVDEDIKAPVKINGERVEIPINNRENAHAVIATPSGKDALGSSNPIKQGVQTVASVPRLFARGVAQVGLSQAQNTNEGNKLQLTDEQLTIQPKGRFEKLVFGDEPLRPYATQAAELEQKGLPISAAFALTVGSAALDLTPLGAPESGLTREVLAHIAAQEAKGLTKKEILVSVEKSFSKKISAKVAQVFEKQTAEGFTKQSVRSGRDILDSQIDEAYKGLKNLESDAFMRDGKLDLNAFQKSQDIVKKIEKGTVTPEEVKQGLELTNNPEAGFAKFPGVESDPILRKQYDTIDRNLKLAKQGTGGEVERQFRGQQFELSPEQTHNLEKIQESLGLGKRNVRSFEDMTSLAQELGSDPKELLKNTRTGQITDKEVAGLGNLIKTNTEFIANTSKQLEKTITTTEKNILQGKVDAAENQIKQALTKLRIGNTENGRAVVANRILAQSNLDPVFWYKQAEKQLGKSGETFTPEIRKAIDDLTNKKDLTGLATFIANLDTPTNAEKAVTLWKAGLLTSPTTHLANIFGNITMAGAENVSNAIATPLDKLVSLFTGKRTKSFSLGGLKAESEGAVSGLRKAPQILKQGRDLEGSLGKLDMPRTVEFKNKLLERYKRTVFGALAAEDKVFKETALKGSLYEQARVQAINEGLKGQTLKERIKYLYTNPTDEMVAEAIDAAEFRTFNNDNPIANAIGAGKQRLGGGGKAAANIVLPFTKTPSNVGLRLIDYSPAGIVKTLIQQINPVTRSQKALVEGLSRGITGTGILALGGYMASKGLITGNTPTDPKEKAQWDLEGKQAHAVKLGDKWISLNRISPVGNLLSLGSTIYDSPDKTLVGRTKTGLFGGLRGLTEQTFLQGASQALNVLADPERNSSKYLSGIVGGIIPSVVTRGGRVFDPVVRNPTGILETFKSRIPGLSSSVPPRRDALGNIQKYNKGQLIDPFNTKTQSSDPVVKEFQRLGVGIINSPDTDFKGLDVSTWDTDKYLETVGQITRDTLSKGINSQVYKDLKDDEKVEAIQKAVDNVRGTVKSQFVASKIAEELNKAQTKDQQQKIWERYKNNGALSSKAEKELRTLIESGKVKKKD